MSDFDILVDETTNDYIYEGGIFKLTKNTHELVRQKLSIRLATFLEEWVFDVTFGMPYRQEIFKKNVTKGLIDSIVIAQINLEESVDSILEFTSTLEPRSRSYSCEFKVSVVNEEVTPTRDTLPDTEWLYPPETDDTNTWMYVTFRTTL